MFTIIYFIIIIIMFLLYLFTGNEMFIYIERGVLIGECLFALYFIYDKKENIKLKSKIKSLEYERQIFQNYIMVLNQLYKEE